MKLINYELRNKVVIRTRTKVREHVPYRSPVRRQIRKNLGLWDGLLRLKVLNPKLNIVDDLDETT